MNELNTHFKPAKRHALLIYDADIHPQQAFDILSSGLSKTACAGELGIAKKTLSEWVDKYPEFASAVNEGLAAGQAAWERLSQMPKHEQYCPRANQFALTNIYKVNPPKPTQNLVAPANDRVTE